MKRIALLCAFLAAPAFAQQCATPGDMSGPGLVVEFADGMVETYRRRGDGLIETRVEDQFGTITDRSRYGMFLVEGVEIDAQGKRVAYSELYDNAKQIAPPGPGKELSTRSTSFTEGEVEGSVDSVWRAGSEEMTQLGPCSHLAYLIDVSNTAMHPGAEPEKQRYLYLPEFETGILLEVRFMNESWPLLTMPSVVRGQ